MYHYRFYIDKQIVTDKKGVSTGGDHSRVIDVEADEMGIQAAQAQVEAMLEADEMIGSQAQIVLENPADAQAPALHMSAGGEEGRWTVRLGEDSP